MKGRRGGGGEGGRHRTGKQKHSLFLFLFLLYFLFHFHFSGYQGPAVNWKERSGSVGSEGEGKRAREGAAAKGGRGERDSAGIASATLPAPRVPSRSSNRGIDVLTSSLRAGNKPGNGFGPPGPTIFARTTLFEGFRANSARTEGKGGPRHGCQGSLPHKATRGLPARGPCPSPRLGPCDLSHGGNR